MQVDAKDIPEIAAFMTDFWKFIKSSYIPEDRDEWWDELISCAKNLQEKYVDDPFVVSQVLAYLSYLDKKSRGEFKNG